MSLFVRWQGHAGLGLAQLPVSIVPCWEVLVGAVASLSGLSGLPVAAVPSTCAERAAIQSRERGEEGGVGIVSRYTVMWETDKSS